MKKYFSYALSGAIALVSMYVFTACSSADDSVAGQPEQQKGDLGKDLGTVNTQFVLNIAAADQQKQMNAAMRRSSVTATQGEGGNFRGMDNVSILTYSQDANGKHLYDVSTEAKATATRNYDLAELVKSSAISSSNSRRVIELSLPVGTNTMLFYGKATKPSTANPSEYGNISYSVADNANHTEFATQTRIGANIDHYNATSTMIAAILSRLASNGFHMESASDAYQSKKDADHTLRYWTPGLLDAPYKTVSGNKVALSGDELTAAEAAGTYTDVEGGNVVYTMTHISDQDWKSYGAQYLADKTIMKPLEEILGRAYVQLTTIRVVGGNTEIRSGSGPGILSMMHDLWLVIDKVADADPTNVPEFIAKKMAQRIRNRFTMYFVRHIETGTVSFKSINDLKDEVGNHIRNINTDNAMDANLFPMNMNLPDGAAQMTFDASGNNNTGKFSYAENISVIRPEGTTTVDKFLYPAELTYFGNSPVRVSNETHTTDDYPNTVANWDSDEFWSTSTKLKGWTKNGIVSSTTRSVAMQRDINYGTALLKTTFKYGATTLNDNQAACTDETSDQAISVNGSSFILTGVIVGGQWQKVGWNFLPKAGATNKNFMIYDNYIGEGGNGLTTENATGTPSAANYTLLWDNYDPDHNKQPVYVALEFVNNSGVDFWGDANLIRQGNKFYIVGKLDPTSENFPASRATTDAGNYILPPYKADGSTDTEKVRVFMQDYKTTANFTITANSLKKAYSTIPDLRSSQVSLGLAVDIQWEPGLSFDVNLGDY